MNREQTALLDRELAPSPAQSTQRTAGEAVCTADLAECTCPEFCERDHANE